MSVAYTRDRGFKMMLKMPVAYTRGIDHVHYLPRDRGSVMIVEGKSCPLPTRGTEDLR